MLKIFTQKPPVSRHFGSLPVGCVLILKGVSVSVLGLILSVESRQIHSSLVF